MEIGIRISGMDNEASFDYCSLDPVIKRCIWEFPRVTRRKNINRWKVMAAIMRRRSSNDSRIIRKTRNIVSRPIDLILRRLSLCNLQFNSETTPDGRLDEKNETKRREIGLNLGTAQNTVQTEHLKNKKRYWFYNELISAGASAPNSVFLPKTPTSCARIILKFATRARFSLFDGFNINRVKRHFRNEIHRFPGFLLFARPLINSEKKNVSALRTKIKN